MKESLMNLFNGDNVAPGAGRMLLVGGAGGGLPEAHAGPGAYAYFAGGSAPLAEASAEIMEAGPSGYLLAGGARRRRRATRRRQRGGRSKRKGGRRNSAFKLNLRATIRLRSQSRSRSRSRI